jgi:type II secretory pathway component PulF
MLFAHLAAGVVVIGVVAGVVPRFITTFSDFQAEVPPVTELLIVVSEMVARYWCLWLPLGLVADGGILFGLSRLPRRARWLATVWATLVLLAGLSLIAAVWGGIWLPLQDLMTQLS